VKAACQISRDSGPGGWVASSSAALGAVYGGRGLHVGEGWGRKGCGV